jgi:hypothetical protein
MDAIFGNKQVSKREYEIICGGCFKIKVFGGFGIVVGFFRPDARNRKFPALVAMSGLTRICNPLEYGPELPEVVDSPAYRTPR